MSFDGGAVNLGSAYGDIQVDMSGTERQLNQQVQQLERNLGRSFQRIGSQFQSAGRSLTLALAPVSGFVLKGISAFAKFDDILNEVEARTGATAEQMALVKATALEMGQNTAFSASQAADAMLQLLSSGYDLTDTMTALTPVLNAAAAGTLDLGFAADAITDILAAFQLQAADAGMVADALAQASASSSATMTDLIQGFANVGPIAANFGLSVRDTAAALAVLSENGIKGAEAGTQIKSMLTNMSRNTPAVIAMWDELGLSMYDSAGNMRDLDTIIDDLNLAMDGMSDQDRNRVIQTLAGSFGQMGLSALLASGGIDAMQDSMDAATSAQEMAEARMKSLKGATNQLKSSIETLMINVIGPLAEEYLQPLIEKATVLLNKFNEWIVANPEIASKLGLVLGALAILGPVVFFVGKAIALFGGILGAVGTIIGLVLSPIGLLVAAVAGLYLAFKNNFMGFRDFMGPILESVGEKIGQLVDWVTELIAVFQEEGFAAALDMFVEGITSLGDSIRDAFQNINWGDVGQWLLDGLAMGLDLLSKAGQWAWDNILSPIVTAISTWLSSGQAVADLSAFGTWLLGALKTAWDGMADLGSWGWNNLILPLIQKVTNWFQTANFSGFFFGFGEWVGNALKDAFGLGIDVVRWGWDNLIKPLIDGVANWFAGGEGEGGEGSWAGKFVTWFFGAIKSAISTGINVVTWLVENVIWPLVDGLMTGLLGEERWEDLKGFITWITDGFVSGVTELIGSFNAWVMEKIIDPIVEALGGPEAIASAMGAAKDIAQGIIDGLVSIISGVAGLIDKYILGPIGSAVKTVNAAIDDLLGRQRQAETWEIGGGRSYDTFFNEISGGQVGQPPNKRDSGGRGQAGMPYLIGRQAQPELFVPDTAGRFFPNIDRALRLMGGGGAMPVPAMAGGGGGGGGDTYLTIEIPLEVARDEPNLYRNMERLGNGLIKKIQTQGGRP